MEMNRLILLAAAITGLTFASCSKDDEESFTIESIGGEYVGSATGTMILINAAGEELPFDIVPNGDETAKITVTGNGTTISVLEPTFYSASPITYSADEKYAYPGAIISNIEPIEDGKTISFDVKGYSSMNGSYTVAGDISGVFEGKTLTLDYTFLHAGGMIGTIHFEGTKK